MALPFPDRVDAGRALAEAPCHYAGRGDLLVLALPRGGVPVACAVPPEASAREGHANVGANEVVSLEQQRLGS